MPKACADCANECKINVCIDWDAPGENGCVATPPDIGCCVAYEMQCDPDCEPPAQPPSINGTLDCANWGTNGWCIGNLALGLTASDPQGESLIITGNLGGLNFACEAGATFCSLPLSEGTGFASYLATSALGLSDSGSTNWYRDISPPAITGEINGNNGENGWFITPAELTASVTEDGSGISAFESSLDGNNWVAYTAPLIFDEGIYNFQIRATDIAGNQTDIEQAINVDTTPPIIEGTLTGTLGTNDWYTSPVQASAEMQDATSGIALTEYRLDEGAWQSYTAPIIIEDGFHTVQFRTKDQAGWQSETEVFDFKIDTQAPHIKLPSRWYIWESGEFIIKDETSKIVSLSYQIKDSQNRWQKIKRNWSPYTHKFSHTISWNRVFTDGTTAPVGNYQVTVYAKDEAGNTSQRTAQILIPQPNATPLPTFTPTPTKKVASLSLAPIATEIPAIISSPTPKSEKPPEKTVFSFASQNKATPSPAQNQPASNIVWGATAAASMAVFMESTKKRRERYQARRTKWEAKKKAKRERQAIWDANGAAIYDANKTFKSEHGHKIDSASREKAIAEATVGGVFSAGAYAGNLGKAEQERKARAARIQAQRRARKVNAMPTPQGGGSDSATKHYQGIANFLSDYEKNKDAIEKYYAHYGMTVPESIRIPTGSTATPYPTATLIPLPPLPTAIPLPSPESDFYVVAPDLKDAALQALLRNTNLPPTISTRTLIAMASAETGDGYHWDQEREINGGGFFNSGIMQVDKPEFKYQTGAPGYSWYNNSATGFNNSVQDAVALLNHLSDGMANGTYTVLDDAFTSLPNGNGDTARLLVYYNGGENDPIGTYQGKYWIELDDGTKQIIKGNQYYLEDVAQYLENSQFGPEYNDPLLAEDLRAAQEELNVLVGPDSTPTPSP